MNSQQLQSVPDHQCAASIPALEMQNLVSNGPRDSERGSSAEERGNLQVFAQKAFRRSAQPKGSLARALSGVHA